LDSLDVNVAYRDVRAHREHRDELIALTGSTQVPCLVINGRPLLESADIVAWLKSHFPEKAS
jgi:glutathione S-transferase